MQPPRRFAPSAVHFAPDQLSSLDRIDCPVSPEYAIYGPDPDGQEIEWLTDKMTYSFLQEVTVHFLSASPKKLKLKKKYLKVLKNIESTLTPSPMLAPVERATQGIGDLRATIIRATWVIAALVIITAFIKSLVSG